jgi:tRNA A-37 threonylcarbamoyl transferase component Bud32
MRSPLDEGSLLGSIVADTYRITARLGVGGMGQVFAADHLRLPGKRVAIKVLHAALATGEILARFRREAEIASRIGHPNIVEVLDFNTLPTGEPFLVMELLTGESLAARLRRGRPGEKASLDIARQIGSALAAAHRLEVVHRDLKPDNVFLCPRDVDGELRDHVKVLDFGISKIRNSATVVTQDAAILGTPFYMSPEQASGKNQEIDGRTDIFALGAIVFEMLTGVTAFPGDSIPAVIFQVVFQPHPSLANLAPETSPKVIVAIDRALAKNPGERFATMADFVEALTGRPLMDTARIVPAAAVVPAGEPADALAGTAVAPAGEAGLGKTAAAPMPALASSATIAPSPARTAAPVQRKRGRAWRYLAGATVIAAAALALLLRSPAPTPVADRRPLPVAPTRPAPTPPSAAIASIDARPAEPAPPVVSAPSAPDEKSHDRPARGKAAAKDEALSPSLLTDLEGAERALAAGNTADAIRLARHSLYERKTLRASSILTRAFCVQRDLGAAKAELAHVAPGDRARVVRACRAAGLNL